MPPPIEGEFWFPEDLACRADVSVRQLWWWRDHKIVVGHTLRKDGWSFRAFYRRPEAMRVMIMGELLRRGLTLYNLRKLRGNIPEGGLLLIVGGRLLAPVDDEHAIRIAAESKSGTLAVDIDRLLAKLLWGRDRKPAARGSDPLAWMR